MCEKVTWEIIHENNNTFFFHPLKIERLFINLFRNSIQALDYRSGKIVVEIRKKKNFCKITVEDNGGGIPEEIIDKIFDPDTSVKESLRLYETDINIITMSFYSNFTDNITKLNISNKEKLKTLSQISNHLVDGEIYSEFYWHYKSTEINDFQGINQIMLPKYLLNNMAILSIKNNTSIKKKKEKEKVPEKVLWDFSGKRIFYLNPHIIDRFWKISVSMQVYSHSHLSYYVELIWNIVKSRALISQEKTYKKILFKLVDTGIEPKDFENLYKGFTLGQNEIKENDDLYKDLKVSIKKYFTDYQSNCLREFQVGQESHLGQLDKFLLA